MGTQLEERIGQRVAELREAAELTQARLAERVGVAHETISRLERGASIPSVSRLQDVARALGVDVVDLLEPATGRGDSKRRARTSRDRKQAALDALVKDLERADVRDVTLVHEIARLVLKWRKR